MQTKHRVRCCDDLSGHEIEIKTHTHKIILNQNILSFYINVIRLLTQFSFLFLSVQFSNANSDLFMRLIFNLTHCFRAMIIIRFYKEERLTYDTHSTAPILLLIRRCLFKYSLLLSLYNKKKTHFNKYLLFYIQDLYSIMSDKNDEKKSDEQRPLGAVLGWLNLSPTLPNNQDNMAGLTAGLIDIENCLSCKRDLFQHHHRDLSATIN